MTKKQRQFIKVGEWLNKYIVSNSVIVENHILPKEIVFYDFYFKDNVNAELIDLEKFVYENIKDDKKHLFKYNLDTNKAFSIRTVNNVSSSPILDGLFDKFISQQLGINHDNLFSYIHLWISKNNPHIIPDIKYSFDI